MTVYVIGLIDIADRAGYDVYSAGFMPIFANSGGTLLAVDESPTVVEGDWPHTRTVLLSFPDAEAMQRWYNSAAYQALAQHRFRAATASIAMLKGLG